MTSTLTDHTERRRLQPYAWAELATLPKRKSLIKGLLDCGAMSVIYGDSNSGKTFLALDVALHIVLGKDWRDKKITRGSVVYIAAEGGLGIKERLDAFYKYHTLKEHPPFYIIPSGIDLCSSETDAEEIIQEINALDNVCLVVIDTLARAMSGGNENNPDDMGAFIRNCDRIKMATNAHVTIIHHSGKDTTKGARGHSALRAAVDTEIEVQKDNTSHLITAEVKKQRDKDKGQVFAFELKPIEVGQDEDGDAISSCVLISNDYSGKAKSKKPLTGQKKRAMSILYDCMIAKGQKRFIQKDMNEVKCITIDEFREALKTSNIVTSDKLDNVRRGISRVIDSLNDAGLTVTYGDYIWLP